MITAADARAISSDLKKQEEAVSDAIRLAAGEGRSVTEFFMGTGVSHKITETLRRHGYAVDTYPCANNLVKLRIDWRE